MYETIRVLEFTLNGDVGQQYSTSILGQTNNSGCLYTCILKALSGLLLVAMLLLRLLHNQTF